MEEPVFDHAEDEIIEVYLPLSRLLLDEENFRIDEVDDQQAAMFAVLRQQREGEKIFNLAKDIVERGRLTPGDRLMVVPDDGQFSEVEHEGEYFVVMEGNRRITALKLLENPQLIQEAFPRLCQQFEALSKRVPNKRLLSSIPCVVLPDRDSALDWVEIKHSTDLDGIGLEKWDARATARFAERKGRFRRWRIALKRLDDAKVETAAINSGIEKKTTAVDRVLGSRDVRDSLGLIFRDNQGTVDFENGDETAGVELLRKLLEAMADPDFKTGTVHALEDRTIFVRGFQDYAVKGTKHTEQLGDWSGEGQTTPDSPTVPGSPSVQDDRKAQKGQQGQGNTKASGRHPLRNTLSRKCLAPRGLSQTFHVKDATLNSFYGELRELPVKNFKKAAGILTRAFLEMSCDSYLELRKLPIPGYFAQRSVKRWADAKLREKVEAVLTDLDPGRQDVAFIYVRKALGGNDWLHSIDTLHALVHDHRASISEQEVKMIWDRYHPFFQRLHDRISAD